jgi:hypothetical protein
MTGSAGNVIIYYSQTMYQLHDEEDAPDPS